MADYLVAKTLIPLLSLTRSVWAGYLDYYMDNRMEPAAFDAPLEPEQNTGGLVADGLGKSYRGREVVTSVNLSVATGQVAGLLGPNGAGKTTTFYMIVGLVSPNHGRILLDGQDVTRQPMYRRAQAGVSYLPQEPSVFRTLTVRDTILAILETLSHLTREERMHLIDDLMAEL